MSHPEKSEKKWPATKVALWPLDRLRPYAGNARIHSPAQVAQIAASIKEWGFTNPILAEPDGTVIAGHGRLMAATELGLAKAPVMVAEGWTRAQVRAYVLADNKIAENAAWDEELLRLEVGELSGSGFDLGVAGFSAEELAALTATGAGLTDPDDVPEPWAVAVAREGDVWLLGGHRVVCGDSTDPAAVAACLGRETPHLMVTDPPYGVEYDANWRNGRIDPETGAVRGKVGAGGRAIGKVLNDDRADWREAWALFPGDVAYVWHAGIKAHMVAEGLIASGFDIRAQIIWAKNNIVIGRGDYHQKHEPCLYVVRHNRGGALASGPHPDDGVGYLETAEIGNRAFDAKAGGVHAAADRQQFEGGGGGL